MQESIWLIKSSGRILGPMSLQEVTQGLRTREYTLMDEVAQPCSRWLYICDQPELAKLAEEIRLSNLKSDGDTTQAASLNRDTQTLSLTEAQDPGISDELTEEISESKVQDVLYQSFEDHESKSHSRKIEDVYVYESDKSSQAQAQASLRWLWVLAVAVIFSSVAYIGFNHFVAKPIQGKNSAQVQILSGLQSLDTGDYALALNYLSQAHSIRPDDKSILMPLALLEIHVNGETVKALRYLDQLQGASVDSKKVLTAKGLAALKDGNFISAEDFFDKALQLDSLYAPAMINLGATALYKNEPEKVSGYLQMAIKDGHREGITQLMYFEALFQIFEKSKDLAPLKQAVELLDIDIKENQSLYREKLVAKMYALEIMDKDQEIMNLIPKFLDAPIILAKAFKQDLYIHYGRINWQLYSQWCLKAMNDLEPTAYVVSAEAVCLYNSGDLLGASRKIEDAVAQAPKDKLVQSVYSALLIAMNSAERAVSAVERALTLEGGKNLQLPHIVAASLCSFRGNLECSKKQWDQVVKINPNSSLAYAELASIYLSRNQLIDAQDAIDKSLQLSPDLITALNLKERLVQAQKSSGY